MPSRRRIRARRQQAQAREKLAQIPPAPKPPFHSPLHVIKGTQLLGDKSSGQQATLELTGTERKTVRVTIVNTNTLTGEMIRSAILLTPARLQGIISQILEGESIAAGNSTAYLNFSPAANDSYQLRITQRIKPGVTWIYLSADAVIAFRDAFTDIWQELINPTPRAEDSEVPVTAPKQYILPPC